ncbi:tyrosine-type recombinase/integrase [Mongoliitalea daihaiensis]|uniref:tyrosine-type recombinase/integrase n=1 Tax=Mongoliitalea daihaiensis TaxID=2782006 RepID=UPI001F32AA7D|nr:site-specific integrase [Mongoliitalea daihaiensis]UJP64056.1 site-specific integrase [Mongoliitalea daihaiensis]
MTVFYPLSLSLIARRTTQQPPSVIIYINVRVKDFGVKRISTGFTVPEKNFKAGRLTGKSSAILAIGKKISEVMESLRESHADLVSRNIKPSPDLVISNVSSLAKDEYTLMYLFNQVIFEKEADVKNGLATHHLPEKFRVLRNQIEEFIKCDFQKSDIFLYEIEPSFITRFVLFLKSGLVGNGNVTINKKMGNLGQVFNYAIRNDWMNKNPVDHYKNLPEPKTNKEYLTEDQFRSLLEFKLPNPTHEIVKDTFIFMCLTGMAFTDMTKFTMSQIMDIEGTLFIRYVRSKTKGEITVPVFPKVLDIVNKNFMKTRLQGKRNKVMKEINDPVFAVQSMKTYNEKIKFLFEYNDMELDFSISSHAARKTFGNLITKLAGLETASQLLGHSSITTTEKNYVDKNAMEKILERSKIIASSDNNLFNN